MLIIGEKNITLRKKPQEPEKPKPHFRIFLLGLSEYSLGILRIRGIFHLSETLLYMLQFKLH